MEKCKQLLQLQLYTLHKRFVSLREKEAFGWSIKRQSTTSHHFTGYWDKRVGNPCRQSFTADEVSLRFHKLNVLPKLVFLVVL